MDTAVLAAGHWKCIPCGREMGVQAKAAHINGKRHITEVRKQAKAATKLLRTSESVTARAPCEGMRFWQTIGPNLTTRADPIVPKLESGEHQTTTAEHSTMLTRSAHFNNQINLDAVQADNKRLRVLEKKMMDALHVQGLHLQAKDLAIHAANRQLEELQGAALEDVRVFFGMCIAFRNS
jgi:hypothetical protein